MSYIILRASADVRIYSDNPDAPKDLGERLGMPFENDAETIMVEAYFDNDNSGNIRMLTLDVVREGE